MPLTESDRATIRDAEHRLLDPTVRGDPTALSALLADDFVEIGASGRRYTKDDVIAALGAEAPDYEATLTDLELEELAPDLVIVRYRTVSRAGTGVDARHALRTSLWRRDASVWRMFHHQGTLTTGS